MLNKLWITLSMVMFMSGFVNAADNKIYIDQVGEGINLEITQSGQSNKVGTSTTRANLSGDDQIIAISQIGDGNEMLLDVNGSGTTVVVDNQGNYNLVDIDQVGSDALIQAVITGDYNSLIFNGTASDSSYVNSTTGDNNITNITLGATGGSIEQTVTGDTNEVNISQTTNSVLGSEILLSINGSFNIFNIDQSGTDQQLLDINVEGSNGTYTINQSN